MGYTGLLLLTCLFGSIFTLELGVTYKYEYITSIGNVREKSVPKENKSPSFELHAEVYLTPEWESSDGKEKLIKIELTKPFLHVEVKSEVKILPATKLKQLEPIYAHVSEGEVTNFLVNPQEQKLLKNVIKGLARISINNIPEDLDFCNITKKKENRIHRTCTYSITPSKESHYLQSAEITTKLLGDYTYLPNKNILQLAEIQEEVKMISRAWKDADVSAQSSTMLRLETEAASSGVNFAADSFQSAVESIEKLNNVKLTEETTAVDAEFQENRCKVDAVVKKNKKVLKTENLATVDLLLAFKEILHCFRRADKENIKKALLKKEYKEIMPQLLDAVAASGTEESVDAAFESLDFIKGNADILEEYLVALSLSPNPTEHVVKKVMGVLRKVEQREQKAKTSKETKVANEKVVATLRTTLGALSKNIQNEKLLGEVEKFFVTGIEKCETEECTLTFLRGLRNAEISNAVPFLKQLTEKSGKIAYEALLALKAIGLERSQESEKFCEAIFHQRRGKQSTSIRILAAEMLLACYSDIGTLKRLLNALEDQKDAEMSTYIASLVLQKMKENGKLRSDVMKILDDVKHYYAFSQKGASVTFTNPVMPFVTSSSDVNGTYSVLVEMLDSGILKQSIVDIALNSPKGGLSILSLSIQTEGLSGLMGNSDSANSETASAALNLMVSGVALRPYVFFNGMSEVMGLVFSGAGSEPTPVFQGTYSIVDISEHIALENGIPIHLSIEGILSNDLSGAIQTSLWNRNSKSQIVNKLSVLVTGSIVMDADIGAVEEAVTAKGELQIGFLSHLDFYEEPYPLCVQMTQPEFTLISESYKTSSFANSKIKKKTVKRSKWNYPAQSYMLHKKNNQMCALLLS